MSHVDHLNVISTDSFVLCTGCVGESWHAIKDSLTHRPSSQGWAPGVLPLCVCVCLVFVFGWRVCVWWFVWGRWLWVLSYAIHM